MESKQNFERRVLEATGLELAKIPVGEEDDILGGQIFCKRGDTHVVTYGYPERDEGLGIWEPRPENFRVVTLIKSKNKKKDGPAERARDFLSAPEYRPGFIYSSFEEELDALMTGVAPGDGLTSPSVRKALRERVKADIQKMWNEIRRLEAFLVSEHHR